MNYVILGNSIAAVGCIEGIRKNDSESKITVISKENHFVYSRPLISYMLLGKVAHDMVNYRDSDFYEKNKVDIVYNKKAVKIDREEKSVVLDDDSCVKYDKLMLSIGSKPFVPPFLGLEKVTKRYSFMSLDDALDLEKELDINKRVLIIGAGLIGLKCAEGISKKVKSVTVVDLSDKILSSILDNRASQIMKKHLENNGIKFILGKSVTEFEESRAYIDKDNNIYEDFDILVTAVGVKPNIEIAKNAGIETDRGVLVNEKMQTSDEFIYAAGDCAQCLDITTGEKSVLALLPHAYSGGECGGINMTENTAECSNLIPMNAISFFGLHIISAGRYLGEQKIVVNSDSEYKILFTKDNLLKGYIMIGNVSNAGIYTGLIRNMTPLDTIDFELISQKPTLMAFSRTEREKMLSK